MPRSRQDAAAARSGQASHKETVTRNLILALCFTGGTFAIPALAQLDVPLPPSEKEQKQILEDIRAKAFDFEKNLPDFICTQLSHHSVDPKSFNQWKRLETVHEELRVVHHAEEYSLITQNGKQANSSGKRPANLVSLKDFTSALHDVFDPKAKAEFAWTAWDSVRGHRVHMVTFGLRKDNSTFTVGKEKSPIVAGVAGFLYADADTNAIIRIIMAATDVPVKYPLQGITRDLNYDFIRMGDKIYLLPVKADFRSKEGKVQTWDEAEFKDFKKP
jgi:hypothetical protein